ncbi:MAG: hypothetical protein Ct9H300mP1_22270 [Planctomycetaceae bacterium]|nr:MAG: hypothetical protein Ct9H300mP1_22270 [Planctomycetaceae bacterium]
MTGEKRIEVVLHWTEATDEEVRSYVNGIRTHAGGTHESGLRTGVAKAVKNYMDVHDIKAKGVTVTNDDIREGIVTIISVFLGDPMFQGQTKEKNQQPRTVRPGRRTDPARTGNVAQRQPVDCRRDPRPDRARRPRSHGQS